MVSGLALEQLKAINTLQDVDLKFASYYCSAFWGPISIYSFGCGTKSCAFDFKRFHRHCFSSYQVSYRVWHRTCWTWEELVRYPNHLLSHFTQLYQVSPPNYCFECEPKRQGHLSRVWIQLPPQDRVFIQENIRALSVLRNSTNKLWIVKLILIKK